MKITIILYMISLSVYASRSWAQQESAWALSANPVSISYVPKGSAMEAGLSYLIQAFPSTTLLPLPATSRIKHRPIGLMYPVTESWVCFGWRVVSIGRKAYWKGENGIYYRNRTI